MLADDLVIRCGVIWVYAMEKKWLGYMVILFYLIFFEESLLEHSSGMKSFAENSECLWETRVCGLGFFTNRESFLERSFVLLPGVADWNECIPDYSSMLAGVIQ